jgi:hypothetical protein
MTTQKPHAAPAPAKVLVDRAKADDREWARTMLGDVLNDYRQLGMPIHAPMTQALFG